MSDSCFARGGLFLMVESVLHQPAINATKCLPFATDWYVMCVWYMTMYATSTASFRAAGRHSSKVRISRNMNRCIRRPVPQTTTARVAAGIRVVVALGEAFRGRELFPFAA